MWVVCLPALDMDCPHEFVRAGQGGDKPSLYTVSSVKLRCDVPHGPNVLMRIQP